MKKCEVCGKECVGQTCSGACRARLSRARARAHGIQACAVEPEVSGLETLSEPAPKQVPVDSIRDTRPAYVQRINPIVIPDPVLRHLSKQYDIIARKKFAQ